MLLVEVAFMIKASRTVAFSVFYSLQEGRGMTYTGTIFHGINSLVSFSLPECVLMQGKAYLIATI